MIRCSKCKSNLLFKKTYSGKIFCTNPKCKFSRGGFFFFQKKPVLIPFGSKFCIFKNRKQLSLKASNKNRSNSRLNNLLVKFKNKLGGESKFTKSNYEFLSKFISQKTKVLFVGGGTKGSGSSYFYNSCNKYSASIEEIDIYNSSNVTAIADAHYLPFEDESFEIIVIQAVLEHVLNPERVVSEISRVLVNGGLVYAETPFMQTVHMGPNDFLRYTHSGHRWLFREFKELNSGYTHGLFSSFKWIFAKALGSIFRNDMISKLIIRILSRPAYFLDSITPHRDNLDNACGLFFLGKKESKINTLKKSSWIIDYYFRNS